jgi:3-hydroxyacyl-[acyl-carrier-protein] dehydratase
VPAAPPARLLSHTLTITSHRFRRAGGRAENPGEYHGIVKFNLVDRIEHLSDERIVGVKYVSLAEEYLADHFPTFPVLPGVMMLEALTQAAGWLLHHRTDFRCTMAVLKEARNVKYGRFVAPGGSLRLDVELNKVTGTGATFKAHGTVGDATAVQARIELAYFNLADKVPGLAEIDRRLADHNRQRWAVLRAQSQTQGQAPSQSQPAEIVL